MYSKKITIFLIIFILLSFCSFAQTTKGVWNTLQKVSWKYFYDETLGFDVSQPIFGEEIKALDGKEVTIKGFILPVDTDGDYMVLSALPMSQCFFCGGAGPETVMEVALSKNKNLLNKEVTLKGKLKLNKDDFLKLIYKLENVELVSVQ
jgi:hypothetical protein